MQSRQLLRAIVRDIDNLAINVLGIRDLER